MQIECDIVRQKDAWMQEALKFSKPKSKNGKFRAIIIDPPFDNTGCKLGYLKLRTRNGSIQSTLMNLSTMDLFSSGSPAKRAPRFRNT
jgi:16S rRNA G966 N2-methylase RsmD